MAGPTAAELKARFPELDGTAVDTAWSNLSAMWPYYYGLSYSSSNSEIVLNLIAHLFTVETSAATSAAPSRQVSGRSVDGQSVSYAAPAVVDATAAFFGSTIYGQRFLLLTRTRYGGIAV